MMYKKSSGPITSTVKSVFGAGKSLYDVLSNLAWLAAPTSAIIATIGGVRALRPEAVSKVAPELALNATLKESLAQSIREREHEMKKELAAADFNKIKKHDRFI